MIRGVFRFPTSKSYRYHSELHPPPADSSTQSQKDSSTIGVVDPISIGATVCSDSRGSQADI